MVLLYYTKLLSKSQIITKSLPLFHPDRFDKIPETNSEIIFIYNMTPNICRSLQIK